MSSLTNYGLEVVERIKSVISLPNASLHEPSFNGNEREYLNDAIDSTFVSTTGPYVGRFEDAVANFTNSKHAIAVVNGTSALHIALKVVGVRSNDEVLIPAMTFVATANAVSYCNAVPHFIDVDEGTLGLDLQKLKIYLKSIAKFVNGECVNKNTGRRISAVVPMHTFGHIINMDDLLLLANEFNIVVVEDAAESLGSFFNEKHSGTFGLIGALSFNGNKVITSGGGGMILTDCDLLNAQARHLTTTAKVPHAWEYTHDLVGYNYRMPNLNAALGLAQFEGLEKKIILKRILAEKYIHAFEGCKIGRIFKEPSGCKSNYWLNTLMLNRNVKHHLKSILDHSNLSGIMTRPAWNLLSEMLPYADSPRMNLDASIDLRERVINLPSSPFLSENG